jgi:hypothetical protein
LVPGQGIAVGNALRKTPGAWPLGAFLKCRAVVTLKFYTGLPLLSKKQKGAIPGLAP